MPTMAYSSNGRTSSFRSHQPYTTLTLKTVPSLQGPHCTIDYIHDRWAEEWEAEGRRIHHGWHFARGMAPSHVRPTPIRRILLNAERTAAAVDERRYSYNHDCGGDSPALPSISIDHRTIPSAICPPFDRYVEFFSFHLRHNLRLLLVSTRTSASDGATADRDGTVM